MASEPEYVLEDELNARELALANAHERAADAHILALADAEADEAIAAGVKATMKTEDAGVIQIEDDEEPVNPKLRKPMAARSEAWEHFTKVLDSNGKVKEGLCKYCNRPIQATTAELLEELGDKGKGKRKADADASPALGKSSKVR
ncbi:uncharacterized protein LOC124678663 isoform X2 [Lolium rigidum]|uniref:uncharacterized protein LOC124678663 isoform X2 n=1 Tax=Lolium rigidum TaxID=89674 RepID=UPI001F5D695A|nr:uncharacterized protein LOC124678663 isoform X2 [Lolium rigidum]